MKDKIGDDKMDKNFEERLQAWLDGVNEKVVEYFNKHFAELTPGKVYAQNGRRYIRIVQDNSAFAFIDKTNGDVLKAASWKSPAKHARGNIFDEHGGLKYVGHYGPAYLK